MDNNRSNELSKIGNLKNRNSLEGYITPQDLEIEKAILGALMLEKNAINKIADFIHPQVFYKKEHKIIYKAIKILYESGEPIDLLTVSNKLKEMGELKNIGGNSYLTELTMLVASAVHIEYHARIILENYIRRETITNCYKTLESAFDPSIDIFEVIDNTTKNIYEIIEKSTKNREQDIKGLSRVILKNIKNNNERKGLLGVPSGLRDLDIITGGFRKQHFIIIAARPAMGKTSFMLSLIKNAAIEYNIPVGIFSLEMSSEDLIRRFFSQVSQVPLQKINNGDLKPEDILKLEHAVNVIEKAPIYIDDTFSLSLTELKAKARRMKQKYGIQAIFLDYIQLMSNKESSSYIINREQEISSISRGIKALAKELEIPIISLAQVNREVEKEKGTKMPKLSDLRESGSLEQDADIVMFLYRPEYYFGDDVDENLRGAAIVNIAKNRHGQTTEIKTRFHKKICLFTDYEDFEFVDENNKLYLTSEQNKDEFVLNNYDDDINIGDPDF